MKTANNKSHETGGRWRGVYVNGHAEDGLGPTFSVGNPWTQGSIAVVSSASESQINNAVFAAREAHRNWNLLGYIARAEYLLDLAAALEADSENMVQIITDEQGKTLRESEQEVRGAFNYLRYMAGWARHIEGEILPNNRGNEHIFLFRKPYGVVGAILPWNFPLFLLVRKIAPALVAGNTVVVKPSELTPLNALRFCALAQQAQIPAGVLNVVCGDETVGRHLVSHHDLNMITFTGSTGAGRSIMRAASDTLAKVSLELGGNAPALVLDDADLDLAVEAIYASRVENAGQVCNCADRIYVQRRLVKEFTRKIADKMGHTSWGNPLDPAVAMGPLISDEQRQRVVQLVNQSVEDGAIIETGGHPSAEDMGYCFEPTVLSQCRQDMAIVQNEIFGPVLPIIGFDAIQEAVDMANGTPYGLTSSLFTRDIDRAMEISDALEFGETFINREHGEIYHAFHSGWKQSGVGGDDGKRGLDEFMRVHATYLRYGRIL